MYDNSTNITKYSIVIYIIVILMLYVLRPNIIYDKEKEQFREFGFTDNKTILSLPVLSIVLAIIIYIVCSLLMQSPPNISMLQNGGKLPIEYIQKAKNKLKFMAQLPMLVNYSDIFNNMQVEN